MICPNCNREFERAGVGPKKFCSSACRKQAKIERMRLGPSDVSCPICGRRLPLWEVNHGYCYCSIACQRLAVKHEQIYYCQWCGERIPGRSERFCSQKCQRAAHEHYRSTALSNEHCQWCGKRLTVKQAEGGYACSHSCGHKIRYKREGKAPLIGTTRKCVICGCAFEPKYKEQTCCSFACSKRKGGNTLSEQATRHIYTCRHCGREYIAKAKGRDTYCSNECRLAHWAASRPENIARREARQEEKRRARQERFWSVCEECGREFERKTFQQTTCSRECQLARGRRHYAESMEKSRGIKTYICRECGTEFNIRYGDKRREFCSKECCRRFNGRIHKQTRRVRKKGNGPIEQINPRAIFERDGWVCQICGHKVDAELCFPHPLSATLDHIIPLARGGPHTWDNVQLAHFGCNLAKGY